MIQHFYNSGQKYNSQQHAFHLVKISPWPFLVSLSLGYLVYFIVLVFNGGLHGLRWYIVVALHGAMFFFFFAFFSWLADIVREAVADGAHTFAVQKGLRFGFLLFIVSEVMFFFGFFWAFFYSSIAPTVWIGCVWPPLGVQTMNPWLLPLLNTVLLLSSGVTVTYAHHCLLASSPRSATSEASVLFDHEVSVLYPERFTKTAFWVLVTVLFGIIFTGVQLFEYSYAAFSIDDGIYGSLFYLLTGFHGAHVLIGTVFLLVCFFRVRAGHFLARHHLGFETAIWYWHFVDIVWLFLFLFVYVWGQ